MAVLLFVYRGTQKNLLLMQRVPGAPVFLLSRRTPPAACPFLIREKRPCSIMPSGADLHGLFLRRPAYGSLLLVQHAGRADCCLHFYMILK